LTDLPLPPLHSPHSFVSLDTSSRVLTRVRSTSSPCSAALRIPQWPPLAGQAAGRPSHIRRRWIVRVLAENNGVGQVFQPWAAAHVHNTAQRPAIPDGIPSLAIHLESAQSSCKWRARLSCGGLNHLANSKRQHLPPHLSGPNLSPKEKLSGPHM
jgi:hypothetical protein